mgnify:CR=1 FL=1
MWVISDLELNLTIYCKGQTVLESVLVLGHFLSFKSEVANWRPLPLLF